MLFQVAVLFGGLAKYLDPTDPQVPVITERLFGLLSEASDTEVQTRRGFSTFSLRTAEICERLHFEGHIAGSRHIPVLSLIRFSGSTALGVEVH